MKSLDEKILVLLGAFHSVRYGVSPSVSRGAAENHSKKHGLAGNSETLEAAIGAGLVGLSSDSSLSIRATGRARLGKR